MKVEALVIGQVMAFDSGLPSPHLALNIKDSKFLLERGTVKDLWSFIGEWLSKHPETTEEQAGQEGGDESAARNEGT